MEVEYGAEVLDKNGKALGKIDYIIRDTYTGEITKFKVGTKPAESDLFFSIKDVSESSPDKVKLKVAAKKGGP